MIDKVLEENSDVLYEICMIVMLSLGKIDKLTDNIDKIN